MHCFHDAVALLQKKGSLVVVHSRRHCVHCVHETVAWVQKKGSSAVVHSRRRYDDIAIQYDSSKKEDGSNSVNVVQVPSDYWDTAFERLLSNDDDYTQHKHQYLSSLEFDWNSGNCQEMREQVHVSFF